MQKDEHIDIADQQEGKEVTTPSEKVKKTSDKHKHGVKVDVNYSQSRNNKPSITLNLPSTFYSIVEKLLTDNKVENVSSSSKGKSWLDVLVDSSKYNTFKNALSGALDDKDATFKQVVEANGDKLACRPRNVKNVKNQEEITGSTAIMAVLQRRRLGTMFSVPLWHSGFWITFKPPTDSDWIELNRQLSSDKINLGRSSYGLVYSNISVYTNNALIDFALSHIYSTSIDGDVSSQDLKELININDIYTLLWGVACSAYSNGFNYRRACFTDPEKCNHVTEEMLNMSALTYTNDHKLTDSQKIHMTSVRENSMSLESIKRYSEELSCLHPKRYCLEEDDSTDAFSVYLKTPTVAEYIDSGFRWIGDIVKHVEEIVSNDESDDNKNMLITRYGQATGMRQYRHWISKFTVDTNSSSDSETIESLIDKLTPDEYIYNSFLEAVGDYINKSTISLVGIPEYDCPNCNTTQDGSNIEGLKNIIPLDVPQVFFALLRSRIEKIMER